MPAKETVVYQNYQKLINEKNGAKFVKVDLHVHTPASGDAQAKDKYNFKFNKNKPIDSMKKAKQLAKDIVERCNELEIALIAVTDHNTPSNVLPEDLGHTWYELLHDAADDSKEKSICVLPGVEISTDDLHILVILDPKDVPQSDNGSDIQPAAYIVHQINALLRKCRFTLDEYGDYKATGMSSLFDVLEYVEELGIRSIIIPAHIDGGKKAMLEVYDKPSNVYPKLLNHPCLNAVEIVKQTTPENKKIGSGKEAVLIREYFARKRDSNRSPIAWIQNSDGHSIKKSGIGKRFTYVRMGQASFSSLKNALEDPETRVRMMNDYNSKSKKTMIIGIALNKGSGKRDYITFNQNLNCIIGKKATQKSTIVDLILYGVDRFHDDEKDLEKKLIDKGYSVEVFLKKGNEVFCSSRNKNGGPPTWFRLDNTNNSFIKLEESPQQLALPRKYQHEGISGRFSDKVRLMEFIDWYVIAQNSGIKKALQKRDKYLQKMRNNGSVGSAANLQKLQEACDALYKKRKSLKDLNPKQIKSKGKVAGIEIHLPQYGRKGDKPLFKAKIKKAKYKGSNWQNYVDQAELYILDGTKYRSFNRQSTGMKNAAIMAFLMNQDAFGPLIIDEPEHYLDVSAITGTLVPRMRLLKTEQQIICVTKDEHILLSGDAENVIITQSEKDIKFISGDINDRRIQHQVLEIFEGDSEGRALREKNRKLSSILEQ
jgi:hypothetical protein